MKRATKARDLPHHVDKIEAQRKKQNRLKTFRDKTFEDLSPGEKDDLLKNIAINQGLIKPS